MNHVLRVQTVPCTVLGATNVYKQAVKLGLHSELCALLDTFLTKEVLAVGN